MAASVYLLAAPRPAFGGGNGKDEAHGFVLDRGEAVVLVEAARIVVLGIDDKGERTEITARDAVDGIRQQDAAELLALEGGGDSQTGKERRRYAWVARQAHGLVVGDRGEQEAGGRERAEAGDGASCRLHRDEAVADAAANVLRDLLPKITIDAGTPHANADRSWALASRFDAEERRAAHLDAISRRRAAAARFSAGAGSGGAERSAATCSLAARESVMISVSAITLRAASCAAVTTKSLTDRPWISAARLAARECRAAAGSPDVPYATWVCSLRCSWSKQCTVNFRTCQDWRRSIGLFHLVINRLATGPALCGVVCSAGDAGAETRSGFPGNYAAAIRGWRRAAQGPLGSFSGQVAWRARGGTDSEQSAMDIKKPLICQAGSAEAFVSSTATGREQNKYRPKFV